jgi:hypothetical protein
VSGATPENCLYTFVEVFIFKYLSDLGVLTGLHSFSHLVAQYSSNTESEVLEYIEDFASIVDEIASTISEFAELLREFSKKNL